MTLEDLEIRPYKADDGLGVVALWSSAFAGDPDRNAPEKVMNLEVVEFYRFLGYSVEPVVSMGRLLALPPNRTETREE